jgi:hypothetical protein
MLISSNKPQWLDARLPLICLVAGIAVVAFLRNALGLASGALLIAAAISIFASRRLDRVAQRDAEASRQSTSFAPPSRLAATTEFVRAIVPPKLGHRDIDRQHRSLASKAATLRVAFAHCDDTADIEFLLHDLVDSLAQHLDTEITAMARLGVARSHDDVAADRAQVAGAERDFEIYRSGGMSLEQLLERIAGPAVAGHLMRRHPLLPSMETALQQLRDAQPTRP